MNGKTGAISIGHELQIVSCIVGMIYYRGRKGS